MQLLVILGILVAAGGVMFALQNDVPVTVIFLVWRFDGSLALVLMLALALGAGVSMLVSAPGMLRMNWTVKRQQSEIDAIRRAQSGDHALPP